MATSTARVLVIIAALLGPSAALAAQRAYDRRLDAPPGGRVVLDTDIGSVAVVGEDAAEVIVHAELDGSESFLARFHISAEQTPSGIRISGHLDRDGWSEWLGWLGFSSNRVRFTLEVPRDYPVDLRSAGGRLDIRDVNASVHGRTSGGGIHVENVAGTVNVHTSGGSIEATRLNGPTELSTSGGRITVTDSRGDLDLRTSGGGIRIENDDGKVYAHTSGGSIRAELQANHGISLSTSGGSITLLLPQNTRASIDARTSGGGVSSRLPVSTTEFGRRSHLRGDIGGGGAPISLRTSGGSIRILPER